MKKTDPPNKDVLILNAHVFTADPDQPRADALAIQGGRIVFVGSTTEAQERIPSAARVIDGQGCTLMPGFIDSHFHFELGAQQLAGIQLDDVQNQAELQKAICDYAAAHPRQPWLEGGGLHYGVALKEGQFLGRRLLDRILPDRPLILTAYDGHTSWANTPALMASGLLYGRDLPPGNEVVMGGDGCASGELREAAAYQPVFNLIPKPTSAKKRTLNRQAAALAARAGITSAYNMDGNLEQIARLVEMDRDGELPLRLYVPLTINPGQSLESLQEAEQMRREYHSARVRAGCVKFFIDGVIESFTGLLVEPYETKPDFCGESQYPREEYFRLVEACDRMGLQISTHAVGDGGVRLALDAYEAAMQVNPARVRRHRIEHIEVVQATDIPRFKELGVVASMQPLHCPLTVQDLDPWPSRVGPSRWPRSFAWQDIRRAGVTLVFGSDWPVVTLNPILGIHATLARRPWAEGMPDHRQALAETLFSYTHAGAYAQHLENETGMLRSGLAGDVVLLNADLFSTAVEEIPNVHPVLTVCSGQITYEG